jgi:hypothetical protein
MPLPGRSSTSTTIASYGVVSSFSMASVSAAANPVTLKAAYCDIMLSSRLRNSGESSTSSMRRGLPGAPLGRTSMVLKRCPVSVVIPDAGVNELCMTSSVTPLPGG